MLFAIYAVGCALVGGVIGQCLADTYDETNRLKLTDDVAALFLVFIVWSLLCILWL